LILNFPNLVNQSFNDHHMSQGSLPPTQAPNANAQPQAQPQGGGGPIPFVGSKISLISKSDIRYEGTLFGIDTRNSTVSLRDGTN
jgi:hypothetical protein